MEIREAQHNLRTAYLGGFAGQLVSGLLWAASAAVGTWGAPLHAMVLLFGGGILLFPATRAVLHMLGRSPYMRSDNPLNQLAAQVAFTVPVGFILAGMVALDRPHWFFPASLLVVGGHYIPFVFLYGMWHFALLALLMVASGFLLVLYGPPLFALGGWVGAVFLLIFAFVGRHAAAAATYDSA